jgi:hypothetical protein
VEIRATKLIIAIPYTNSFLTMGAGINAPALVIWAKLGTNKLITYTAH